MWLSYFHELLQGGVTGSQLGHGERCGNADWGHEDVICWLALSKLLEEREGKSAIRLRKFPHSGVGGLWNFLFCFYRFLSLRFRIRAAIDAQRLQGEVFGLGIADISVGLGCAKQGQEAQEPHRHQQLHPNDIKRQTSGPVKYGYA